MVLRYTVTSLRAVKVRHSSCGFSRILQNDQQYSMQASYTDFHKNQTTGVNVGNKNRYLVTPLSQVLIALRRFSQNALSFNKSLLHFPYLILSDSDKNV